MGKIGFKTEAQRDAESKEEVEVSNETSSEESTNLLENLTENDFTVRAETIDRMNSTFDYIVGDEFRALDKDARERILSDYTYYSQVEAKLQ